ncbi:hypothetical protein PanWU01x14_207410 [Parasponia andersonii]|uniref:Uncharacterized protein n=1 Tax=Parasponia andersonii TaxID=3476 RepID=A0A2P5BV16_PARAD|nr:hypothetical protein PanWU01x14_207410 [Parasponia andersonii]
MKEDKPALAPRRSKPELTADNGLVLTDSEEIIIHHPVISSGITSRS